MNELTIQTKDYPPFYRPYVMAVQEQSANDPIKLLRDQLEALPKGWDLLSEEEAQYAYAEGKWTIKEVIGHMIDAERIFAIRALHVARQEKQPLIGFDEKDYVAAANFNSRPVEALIKEFVTVRQATLQLFDSFEAAWWANEGVANNVPFVLRALPYIIAGHTAHHVNVLADRYGVA